MCINYITHLLYAITEADVCSILLLKGAHTFSPTTGSPHYHRVVIGNYVQLSTCCVLIILCLQIIIDFLLHLLCLFLHCLS